MKQNSFNSLNNFEGALELMFDLSPDCMFKIKIADFSFVKVNQQACYCYGYTQHEFHGLRIDDIELDETVRHNISLASSNDQIGEIIEIEGLSKRKNGIVFPTDIRYCKIDEQYGLAIVREISKKEKVEVLNVNLSDVLKQKEQQNKKLQLNRDVLRMVAQHRPLNEVLETLALGMEHLMEGMKVSILLLEAKELIIGAAPNFEQEFIDAINRTVVGPDSYPCGIATYRKEQLIIEDIQTSPYGINCKELGIRYNITACWTTPIISVDGIVLGTFAMYFAERKKPSSEAINLIALALDLAEVAIDQSYYQESLNRLNKEYAIQNKELELTQLQLKKDKKIILDREEKLKEAQRLSRVGSWEFNLDTKELLWSEQQYRAYGLDPSFEGDLYEIYREKITLEDAINVREAIRKAVRGNPYFQYEHQIKGKENEIRYILGMGRVVKNHVGKPIMIKGTEQDITELKQAQDAAVKNELKFNELMLNINEIVFIVDLKDTIKYNNPIIYINGDTMEIFGYTHKELKDTATLWTDRIHPEDLPAVMEKGKQLHATQQQVIREYRFRHKKGNYLWIEDNISVGVTEDGKHARLYGSARDITKRKKSEVELLESKERLQMVTQAAKLGSYDWNLLEDAVHWDDRMYEIFGLDVNTSVDDKNHFIASIMHPDDRERFIETFLFNSANSESVLLYSNEYRIIIDGKEKYIESAIMLVRDLSGTVSRVVGTCLDVTERKEAEALLISNEEKGVLLKEIHHRVKNNLQVITSLLSLQSSYSATDEQKKLFADSQYRINSMAIVHEMLYQSDNLSKLDYHDYLNELSQFLIRSIKGANNQVELIIDVPRIHLGIDTAIPLGLLITEILTNSLKYGIRGDRAGIISIKIIKELKEHEKAKPSFILEIGDNGVGYSKAINFKTTNSLGLRLINKLTRQLEGTLKKDNTKKGTNYIISFKEI